MSINKFQLALALTRRLDRLDPATRAAGERIIDSVESGRPHTAQLRAFFPDAWARCGRAAAAASSSAERRSATARLQVLAELEDVLGLTLKPKPDQAPNSADPERVPELDRVSVTDTEWSAA